MDDIQQIIEEIIRDNPKGTSFVVLEIGPVSWQDVTLKDFECSWN